MTLEERYLHYVEAYKKLSPTEKKGKLGTAIRHSAQVVWNYLDANKDKIPRDCYPDRVFID